MLQLNDVLNLAQLIAYIVTIAIAGFGTIRALQMAKVFSSKLYRSRASWTAALLAILIVNSVFGDIPAFSTWGIYNLSFGEISFVFLLLFIFVFVDRNLLTLKEIDFFHRDTLSWSRIRN